MNQINLTTKFDDGQSQSSDQNNFEICEKIVYKIVMQNVSGEISSNTLISDIAKEYSISIQEAKSCYRLALKQIEADEKYKAQNNDSKTNNNSYFYASGYTKNDNAKNDGMDSLSSYASYNRLMFGL